MFRIARYLKPYIPLILITIALLFGQANADLALPDYLSKIVNNGIQQGGVVNAVPEVIRVSEMEKLTLFMTPDEKELVLSQYMRLDQNTIDYQKIIKRFPSVVDQSVYTLNKIDEDMVNKLIPFWEKLFSLFPLWMLIKPTPVKYRRSAQICLSISPNYRLAPIFLMPSK